MTMEIAKDWKEREGKETVSRSNLGIFFRQRLVLVAKGEYIFTVVRGHHRRHGLFLWAFAEPRRRQTDTRALATVAGTYVRGRRCRRWWWRRLWRRRARENFLLQPMRRRVGRYK